jgi:hypothetical protein
VIDIPMPDEKTQQILTIWRESGRAVERSPLSDPHLRNQNEVELFLLGIVALTASRTMTNEDPWRAVMLASETNHFRSLVFGSLAAKLRELPEQNWQTN